MDEFDPDMLLRELSDSIGDSEKFIQYIKERTSLLIERFLEYLPKMSIPIERRELEGGWVLTCRGKH
jgi:nicotinic acid phosphoribosyltransferase